MNTSVKQTLLLRTFFSRIILLLLAFTAIEVQAGGDGIQFFEGTWEEVLEEAKAQRKPVFVDAYTSWCGPCKKMAASTFKDANVAEFYNNNFVNVKMDMEKSEDGDAIASKYGVNAYPTLLYISSSGALIHKAKGFRKANEFIEEGKKGLYDKAALEEIQAEYEAGNREPDFMRKYIDQLKSSDDPSYLPVSSDYFKSLSKAQILDRPNMKMIYSHATQLTSKAFKIMMAHKPAFVEEFGGEELSEKVLKMAMTTTTNAVKNKDESLLEEVVTTLVDSGDEEAEIHVYLVSLKYYSGVENWVDYADTAVKFMDEYDVEDAQLLNTLAWDFSENVEDEALLERALDWAELSVRLKSDYANNDTYAALLYKLGRTSDAIEAAEKAIAIAKIEKKNPKSTKQLLDKIFAD